MKHVHCEFIKAWADGKKIQYKNPKDNNWYDCTKFFFWVPNVEYRIKPEEPNYGEIACRAYKSERECKNCSVLESWKNSANAVIEVYKKHHNIS